VSEANIELASGNRCISVGHKTPVTNATLLALSRADVRYVSTRSIGYNHIDVHYAQSVGICVGNVAYSPDSVADYTLMLMLMAVRNAKSVIRRTDTHVLVCLQGRAPAAQPCPPWGTAASRARAKAVSTSSTSITISTPTPNHRIAFASGAGPVLPVQSNDHEKDPARTLPRGRCRPRR